MKRTVTVLYSKILSAISIFILCVWREVQYVLMRWLGKVCFVFHFLSIRYRTCMFYTLQLVFSMIQKEPTIKKVFDKLRHLLILFRKSSKAIEKLQEKCGLTLSKDCPTRWSSIYLRASRALQVRDQR